MSLPSSPVTGCRPVWPATKTSWPKRVARDRLGFDAAIFSTRMTSFLGMVFPPGRSCHREGERSKGRAGDGRRYTGGVPERRILSIDVFRGLTVAGMVLVNNPGTWGAVCAPLRHADWHGWTPTDLIFPFFLFIVGVAIPLALGRRLR